MRNQTLNKSIWLPIWLIDFCIVLEIALKVFPFASIWWTLVPIVPMLSFIVAVASCSLWISPRIVWFPSDISSDEFLTSTELSFIKRRAEVTCKLPCWLSSIALLIC